MKIGSLPVHYLFDFTFVNFYGTSISIPPNYRKFHRHLRSFGFQFYAQTVSACSRDTRQTPSQGKYSGLNFFLLSAMARTLWLLFFLILPIFLVIEKV